MSDIENHSEDDHEIYDPLLENEYQKLIVANGNGFDVKCNLCNEVLEHFLELPDQFDVRTRVSPHYGNFCTVIENEIERIQGCDWSLLEFDNSMFILPVIYHRSTVIDNPKLSSFPCVYVHQKLNGAGIFDDRSAANRLSYFGLAFTKGVANPMEAKLDRFEYRFFEDYETAFPILYSNNGTENAKLGEAVAHLFKRCFPFVRNKLLELRPLYGLNSAKFTKIVNSIFHSLHSYSLEMLSSMRTREIRENIRRAKAYENLLHANRIEYLDRLEESLANRPDASDDEDMEFEDI